MLRSLVLGAACAAAAALLLPSGVWRLLSRGLTRWSEPEATSLHGRLFSKAELSRYSGGKGSPGLYLAVLGQVFDVRKGIKHYGPSGSYRFFAGAEGAARGVGV